MQVREQCQQPLLLQRPGRWQRWRSLCSRNPQTRLLQRPRTLHVWNLLPPGVQVRWAPAQLRLLFAPQLLRRLLAQLLERAWALRLQKRAPQLLPAQW